LKSSPNYRIDYRYLFESLNKLEDCNKEVGKFNSVDLKGMKIRQAVTVDKERKGVY
jgi:hypothetical protein